MSEKSKDVDAKIEELETAKEKYMSENTVISVGGYSFTPAKIMIVGTLVSTVLGGLYGAFEVYKDYQGMKKAITEYVAPDLGEINKKLELVQQSSEKSVQYTQDIKNDLKQDIRRLEGVVESVERSSKQSAREAYEAINSSSRDMKQTQKEMSNAMKESERRVSTMQREIDSELKNVRREVDEKIRKALDNPLAK